jgi:hypothetical protein
LSTVTTGWAAAFPFIAATIMIVVGWVGGLSIDRRYADLKVDEETRDLVAQSTDALTALVSIPPLAWGILQSLNIDQTFAVVLAILAFTAGITVFLVLPLMNPVQYSRFRFRGLGIANLLLLAVNVVLATVAYF